MREYKYILDKKGNPKIEKDVLTWGRWYEGNTNRIVKQTKVGKYVISTVFLGMDMRFSGKGKPILWETMVFRTLTKKMANKKNADLKKLFKGINKRGLPHDKLLKYRPLYKAGSKEQADGFGEERYASRVAAVRGHNKMVKLVTKTIKK